MGNGILTLTPRGSGLEELYGEDEVAYFDDVEDLAVRVRHFAARPDQRLAMARKGWERNHRDYNGTAIARFIVALSQRDPSWRDAPWAGHVFGG
jgi:hypothetical protein